MIAFRKERLEHAICYFANEWKKRTRKYLPSMGLYKLLAFMDFWGVENHGHPVFDLAYVAMKMGPVPKEIYDNRTTIQSPLFQFKDLGEGKFEIIPLGKPDMEYYSVREAEKMANLMEIFGDPSMTTTLLSESSHQEIIAWRRAFKERPNQTIDYKLTFPGDIDKKDIDKLDPIEEGFLAWRGWKLLNESR